MADLLGTVAEFVLAAFGEFLAEAFRQKYRRAPSGSPRTSRSIGCI
jgi:hypothetical protein